MIYLLVIIIISTVLVDIADVYYYNQFLKQNGISF